MHLQIRNEAFKNCMDHLTEIMEKNVAEAEESSYSSSTGVSNLKKAIRRTGPIYADNSTDEATNNGYIIGIELEKANLEDDSETTTVAKKKVKNEKDNDSSRMMMRKTIHT